MKKVYMIIIVILQLAMFVSSGMILADYKTILNLYLWYFLDFLFFAFLFTVPHILLLKVKGKKLVRSIIILFATINVIFALFLIFVFEEPTKVEIFRYFMISLLGIYKIFVVPHIFDGNQEGSCTETENG